MKKFIQPLIALSLLYSVACSQKGSSQEEIVSQRTNMKSEISLNNEMIGEIERTVASEADIEKARERKRASSLLPLPISPDHNATVFKVSGLADENQYLVAPRVYVYSTQTNTLPKNSQDEVMIPFNIAIIDGLSANINTVEFNGNQFKVPQALRVTDYDNLKAEIINKEKLNAEGFNIGVLPGCPSRISIVAAGTYYDVTPKDLRESDYCELNTPFTVHLKVPAPTAQYILGTALRSNLVDIVVNYAVMAPVPVSQMSVKFDKEKLFESIQMNLTAKYPPYAEADVRIAVEKVMKSSRMNIHIQGDYNEQMKLIVQKAIETFFVPYKPDPKVPAPSSCNSAVCLNISYTAQSYKEYFSVEWTQSENMKIEKVIRIGSKLQPINDQTVTIGRDKKLNTLDAIEFTNMNPNPVTNPGNVYSAGLTPQRGNMVEFIPTVYAWERRDRGEEKELSSRVWEDCTGRVGWENKCSYTTRIESLRTREFSGEEVWAKTENPLGAVPRLMSGIKAYFRFSNGESLECPLDVMEGFNQADRRVIKIENTPQCHLFDNGRTTITDFGLINSTRLDNITYTAGQRYVTNYGKDWDKYKTVTYSPEVRIAGMLKLIGAGFISVSEIK
ncbi:hypothetical protein [Bdellovibrio bacteriovorus]|uniref:hypothetical protein n=1 Tax=Bdellovibrio bacteriovorus TaxID=959 RepID=UPI0035A64A18